jgi:hypothetical protein
MVNDPLKPTSPGAQARNAKVTPFFPPQELYSLPESARLDPFGLESFHLL